MRPTVEIMSKNRGKERQEREIVWGNGGWEDLKHPFCLFFRNVSSRTSSGQGWARSLSHTHPCTLTKIQLNPLDPLLCSCRISWLLSKRRKGISFNREGFGVQTSLQVALKTVKWRESLVFSKELFHLQSKWGGLDSQRQCFAPDHCSSCVNL